MLNVIGDRLKHFWSHAFTQRDRELCHRVWLIAFRFHFNPSVGFFFFFLRNSFIFYYLFIYLFIFGCVGSSFLCEGFL